MSAPPWLQEQLAKLQQAQQNLQGIVSQRQHLEMEKAETARASEELEKAPDDAAVYKHAGPVLVRSTKKELAEELAERREMAETRAKVLEKQEARVKEDLKEQEEKISSMIKGQSAGST
ncbi:MAG: prefoldin subunit beta [Nitrosopumilus sp.]|nr:prefoldin subunit beta [Nitrosopumilus sp.]CAI9832138.1 Prefoldin subunit beta [Nitrosopumilaceae archaeon]MDA7941363.1 prefoldin subunit beta [Nitrosopumilus sp.]MDA7942773.1 prefoldin subunit beta [Nitrosopumilus sp.]MDA7952713.1 prefoldin subunit beta [Nitrosopumilus sp.]